VSSAEKLCRSPSRPSALVLMEFPTHAVGETTEQASPDSPLVIMTGDVFRTAEGSLMLPRTSGVGKRLERRRKRARLSSMMESSDAVSESPPPSSAAGAPSVLELASCAAEYLEELLLAIEEGSDGPQKTAIEDARVRCRGVRAALALAVELPGRATSGAL
jgi:hypothetical protein